MEVIFRFLFIFLYLILLSNVNSIIENPLLSRRKYNPIDYKIIILSESIQLDQSYVSESNSIKSTYKVFQNYDKLFLNSYVLSQDFFIFDVDFNSKDKYLILENNLYKVIKEANEIFQIDFIRNLNFSFIDCINANKQAKYEQPENYIYKINTIYGKENEEIYFYYIDSDIYIFSGIENIDNNNSCKLLKFFSKDFFICIYSQKNITKLSILYYTNEKQIIILHTYEVFNNIFFRKLMMTFFFMILIL